MKMTEEKFNMLKKLVGKLSTGEVAQIVGLKPQSIPAYGRFKTWEDYQAYKVEHNAKQKAMKKPKQLEIPMPHATTDTRYKLLTNELLADIADKLQQLIDMEVRKNEKRDAYHARKGDQLGVINNFKGIVGAEY